MVRGRMERVSDTMKRFSESCGVHVRTASLADAAAIIELNKEFRIEMAQWERDPVGVWSSPSYQELSKEEIENIITEENAGNLIVAMRPRTVGDSRSLEQKAVGYLYSYPEPWGESGEERKRGRRSGDSERRGSSVGRRSCSSGRQRKHVADSIYIAELFVLAEERGLGLGEMLLTESLRMRCGSKIGRSHLYVSSRNVCAIKCYERFGYFRSAVPSDDKYHDLVMELKDNASFSLRLGEAASRLEQRVNRATFSKCTPPASPINSSVVSSAWSSPLHSVSSTPPPQEADVHALPELSDGGMSWNVRAPKARVRITRAIAAQLRSGILRCDRRTDGDRRDCEDGEEEAGEHCKGRKRIRTAVSNHKSIILAPKVDKSSAKRIKGSLFDGISVIGASLYRGIALGRRAG